VSRPSFLPLFTVRLRRTVLRTSYLASRLTLSRWGRSKLMMVARLGDPSQYLGSVHKDSPCRIPQELTPLLTPLRALHAETVGNCQQGNRLR
jgi:hypothetical protein